LGGTLNNLGLILIQKGKLAEGLAMYRRAAERGESAAAQAPQVINNDRFLTIQLNNVAHIERQLGHANEALAVFRHITEVWRRLARDNPAVPSLHSGLFSAYRNLASYQRELKQNQESERTMRLARGVIDRLPSDGPEDLFNLACCRAACSAFLGQGQGKSMAEEQAEQKQEADLAMQELHKAIAAGFRDLERLRKEPDLNPLRDRKDFKTLEAELEAQLAAAPTDKAKANHEDLARSQKLPEADRNNKRLRADRAASQHAIALIQLDLGNLDEVQKHLQQAIALREALVRDEPKNERYQTELAVSRFALGDFYWRSGRLAEGAKVWQREFDALEEAARQARAPSPLAGQLVDLRRMVAQHYVRAGLWSEATSHYSQALPLEGARFDDLYAPACTELRAGNTIAYRRTCAAMAEQLSEAEFHQLCGLAWACCLIDSAGTEFSQTIKLILKKARQNPPNEFWECHVLGLVHYRAGQFDEAIAQANKSITLNPTWHGSISNWPVLALAYHRLGHAAEAKQWLEKSKQEWHRLSPLPRSADGLTALPSLSAPWYENWHDWLTFEILFGEASLTITGTPPVEEAYDHAHRSVLYSRLGETAKAEAEWQATIQILPKEPMIWLARARQLVELQRKKEAEDALARIEAFAPNDPEVWKKCGRLRLTLGQTAKATADFHEAQTLIEGNKAELKK
jgi:tetratricopeptide (TPR) repeat protein